MCVDHSLSDFPTSPRDTPLPYASVVVWNVLNEPVDRIVGVRDFVDLTFDDRPMMYKVSFRLVLPARVLIRDDVAFPGKFIVRPDDGPEIARPVRRDSVSGA